MAKQENASADEAGAEDRSAPRVQASNKKVIVACKLPNGLILRLFQMVDHDEPVMGGGFRTVKKAVQLDQTVTVFGCAKPFGEEPKCQIVGGYALTPGIDSEFFGEWMKQNKDSHMVKNKIIMAFERFESAAGAATEQAAILSGLEPLKQLKDPRAPIRIETADEQKKKAA